MDGSFDCKCPRGTSFFRRTWRHQKSIFVHFFYHYTLGYRKHAQHDHICVDIDECSEELVTCFDPELWRQSRPELRQELNLFTSECINYAGQRVFHLRSFLLS